MGQVLHGSATTTEAVRRAIQNRQAKHAFEKACDQEGIQHRRTKP